VSAEFIEAVLYLAESWRCVIAKFEVLHPWEFFEVNVDSELVLPLEWKVELREVTYADRSILKCDLGGKFCL
jgi:hypothetical protein